MSAMAALAAPSKKTEPRRAPIQKKLSVGAANDRLEHEADRVAARVGAASPTTAAPPPTISRMAVQRAITPVKHGPEEKDKPLVAPEARAQKKADPTKTPEKKPAKSPPKAQRKAAPGKGPEKKPAKPAAKTQRKAAAGKTPEKQERKPPETRGVAMRKGEAPTPAAPSKIAPPAKVAPRADIVGPEGGEASLDIEAKVQKLQARPAPGLTPEVRNTVEAAVGSDLGDVRVHSDATAAGAARDLGARAFTVGRDMFFGQGEYRPGTTEGRRLIAHEATHTVQQRGGSAAARKIQRDSKTKTKKLAKPKITDTVATLGGKSKDGEWALGPSTLSKAKGALVVPTLKLPRILDKLKGEENPKVGLWSAAVGRALPAEGSAFTVPPQPVRTERSKEAPFEIWLAGIRKDNLSMVESKVSELITKQKEKGYLVNDEGEKVYVLKRSAGERDVEDVLVVGTLKSLPRHDSILRPMIAQKGGGRREMQADHILEDQLGGPDVYDNLWLLEAKANRTVGKEIQDQVDATIKRTIDLATEEKTAKEADGFGFKGAFPQSVQDVKRRFELTFSIVQEGKSAARFDTYWTRAQILDGDAVKHYRALTENELVFDGFKAGKKGGLKPERINVFPTREGGRPYPFKIVGKGAKLALEQPGRFFRGVTILDIGYHPDWPKTSGQAIAELWVEYVKKDPRKKGAKDAPLVHAEGPLDVLYDPMLGFGGYIDPKSIPKAFKDAKFTPLSPISFSDVALTPEGDLKATGNILSSKSLLPGLNVPLRLKGDEIYLDFALPADKLSLGPVSVVDPAIQLGVGDKGFFIAGSTGVVIDQVGHGTLMAKATDEDVIIGGDFYLDMDFLEEGSVKVSYSLLKDDFDAEATIKAQKKILPGVKGGQVKIKATRETFGVSGALDLDGPLAGSQVTVDYSKDKGLEIAGRDLPLPIEKLPGVTDAKVTVIVRRQPETGEWKVSGGGKAGFEKGGAKGSLDILFDGDAVDFTGRVGLEKGPASGFVEISASNRATDEEGKPKEGAPTGPFSIWGKGEAKVKFGKYLKGTVGIDYTREGRVILSGDVAMAQSYDLFRKKDLSPEKPLFEKETPDFPIWGVKVGPVGIGIFAFGYASISAIAYVGPGQLSDAHLGVKDLDLEQPELATVMGGAKFTVPAFAGLHVSIGGGLKAQLANAYAKGKLGLYGDLGLLIEGSFDVNVSWNHADGFEVGALAKIDSSPKFEFGVEGSLEVGVDLWLTDISKEWGPWKKPLGTLGPDMPLTMAFPVNWSEKDGLKLDVSDLTPPKPKIEAASVMKDAFDTLV